LTLLLVLPSVLGFSVSIVSEFNPAPPPAHNDLPQALPAWLNESLWYGSPNYTPYVKPNGTDGYPDFIGENSAEGCPSQLKFNCSECADGSDGCNSSPNMKPGCRPCENGRDHNPSQACRMIPRQPSEVGLPTRPWRPMSRLEILQRGIGWIVNGFEYKWHKDVMNLESCSLQNNVTDCPKYRYTLDCDGFVKMSWGMVDGDDVTARATQLECSKMLPGDAITYYNSANGDFLHAQLFRGVDQQHSTWTIWQMGGGDGKMNQIPLQPLSTEHSDAVTHKCWTRQDLIDSDLSSFIH